MDPEEIEFLAENQIITIVPTFNSDVMHLIFGDFGPFRAGLPTRVPLWVGMHLKQQQKCHIQPPDWMNMDKLVDIKENEKNSRNFTKMPNEHYMIIAKILLASAEDDISRLDEIRTIIKDIWDIRMSKQRSSIDMLVKNAGSYAAVDNLTQFEINSSRPLLTDALDQLYRMKNNKSTNRSQSDSSINSPSFSRNSNSFLS